jgi:serine/threonine-protein phosphatase PGAM5
MRRAWLWCLLCVVALPAAAQMREATQPAGKGVHYVYMVRHGIYDRDTTATDDRTSNGLSALGHEQAKLVGARLAVLGIKFDRLISSEFLRAKQTADDMGALMKMTPTRDGALNECTPASVNATLMASEKPADVAACDSVRAVAWQRYFIPTPTRDTYDVLVCHGNVIRWTLMRALGADTKLWSNQDIGNCSLTIIAVRPDGTIRLVEYSDVGHIPVDKQSWSGRGGGWVKPARP